MIHTLSDEELKKRLKETLADERQSVRLFLALLIEFDRRRLQEDSPHPSLFSFCIRELGLAEAEAYKRIQTARAAAKFPVILDLLEAGVLHVSAIAVLAPHLKEDTHVVLLERARGLSKRQLEFFVASLSEARPAVRDSIVPVPGAASSRGPACLESAAQGPAGERAVGPASASPGGADCCPEPSNSSPRATERIDAPSSQARVAFTADEETLAYIETIRQRLSHRLPAAPSRQLGPLFKAALKALLRQLAPLGAACLNGEPARRALDAEAPLLVLSGDGYPEPAALQAFLARARAARQPLRWTSSGRSVAAYYARAADLMLPGVDPAAAELAARALDGCAPQEAPGWIGAANDAEAAFAERALFAALPKDNDGYIAKLDRRWSIALSSVLLKFPITPNDITSASLVLGLLGAWWLASGNYGWTLAGAALLWFCCLLDGCDGEVARLKLLCSPSGAAYDLWANHVAHLATFVAIPIGVHRAHPALSFKLPGALLVSGFLACMYSVWHLVLRKPESERGPYALLIERVASRDYVYLILALAALGHLDWFLWAAGVGSHLFWVALWLLPAS